MVGALLLGAGASGAGAGARTVGAAGPGSIPFVLPLGGTVVVGTQIRCIATGTVTDRGILCSLGGAGGQEPIGSLSVALSARGEALIIKLGDGGPRTAWRLKAVHRAAAAPRAAPPALPVRTAGVGASWRVLGTDIRCDVRRVVTLVGVVCSRYDDEGPRPRSNSIAMTRFRVGLYRYDDGRRAQVKIEQDEPAARAGA